MITVIVLCGVGAVVGAILLVVARYNRKCGLGTAGMVMLIVGLVMCALFGLIGVVVTKQVNRINAELGTSYTAEEFFWTGEVIMKMVEGEAVRLKVEK